MATLYAGVPATPKATTYTEPPGYSCADAKSAEHIHMHASTLYPFRNINIQTCHPYP